MALTSVRWSPCLLPSVALLTLLACQREPKPVVRTKPWPAPASVQSAPAASTQNTRYQLVSGIASVDVSTRRQPLRGTVSRLEGSIDWDPARPELTRALLRADLLSLSIASRTNPAEDASWTARAFDWLELGAERATEQRELDRWAELRLVSLQPHAGNEARRVGRPALVTAHGELTLHHFRVPVELELEVDTRNTAKGAELVIRTRRPLLVSLAAHDILPREPSGSVLPGAVSELGKLVARQALVAVEVVARAQPPATEKLSPKP